tara:strand:+ start:461 stop:655 length:195 start_codon:yes stop_codon:yes gene_type:complete
MLKLEITKKLTVTEKAIRVELEGCWKGWLPLSVVEISEPNQHGEVYVDIPEWLARKKGFLKAWQ